MCIIVDVNLASEILPPTPSADLEPIYRAIENHSATLVYGGKLRREYERTTKFRRWLMVLDRQGSARYVSDSLVDAETQALIRNGQCVSDDQHIIALARIGGARLLCTNDDDLATDFRNPALISKPRGNIYRRPEHSNLIRIHCRRA